MDTPIKTKTELCLTLSAGLKLKK